MEKTHDDEQRKISRSVQDVRDHFGRDEAANAAAGSNKAKRRTEFLLGEEVDRDGGQGDQPGQMRERDRGRKG